MTDCILLMDEAEIFLSQRQKNDDSISRNAMVSGKRAFCVIPPLIWYLLTVSIIVFLRILEYYPGILFLTTNRPGALDEAVKSRVHLSLRYPALEIDETLAIFQRNSRRLQIIEEERARLSGEKMMKVREGEILGFASAHFHKDPSARWNGRQIRNAFQIAASLAHYDKHINPNLQEHYIGKKHFEDVAKASRDYDRYRQDLFSGKNDDELAQDKEDRGYPRDDRIFPSRETSMAESPGATSYRGQASYGRYSTPPRR
ncbi:putative AAA family protein [Rosellinia necatrix]|uniref:Putative AAA family protein n=1 Tax=Rosellinia necatrix TaxID=77044 RepID=A0A1S8AA56_ROSNE|nr:putative AAA family protein [Rosellinia necatrix]